MSYPGRVSGLPDGLGFQFVRRRHASRVMARGPPPWLPAQALLLCLWLSPSFRWVLVSNETPTVSGSTEWRRSGGGTYPRTAQYQHPLGLDAGPRHAGTRRPPDARAWRSPPDGRWYGIKPIRGSMIVERPSAAPSGLRRSRAVPSAQLAKLFIFARCVKARCSRNVLFLAGPGLWGAAGHRRKRSSSGKPQSAFMALRWALASSSDWPLERYAIPGTAAGTVFPAPRWCATATSYRRSGRALAADHHVRLQHDAFEGDTGVVELG